MYHFINHVQHDFIPGKSCATQLVFVLGHIGYQLDSCKQANVIYLNMSKSLYKVNRKRYLSKHE